MAAPASLTDVSSGPIMPPLSRKRTRRSPHREMQSHAAEAAALLRSLGNEQRLLILCHLVEAELGVGELLLRLDLSQSALSQHLAVLREAELVQTRREGLQVFYSIAPGPVQPLMATLHSIYCT
jgi:DNA-binding transcriptional ArsR family regulator